jgi:glycosyltransferase involved in cell wall biosynthesis
MEMAQKVKFEPKIKECYTYLIKKKFLVMVNIFNNWFKKKIAWIIKALKMLQYFHLSGKKIRIAIEGFPFRYSLRGGPMIFLSRLAGSIERQKLALLTTFKWPFYDIALFKISSKSKFNKPYVLRIDGLFIDKNNTKFDSQKMNQETFASIEKASGLIFNSGYCQKIVEKLYGKKIDKPSEVIFTGVDLDIFKPTGNNYREKLNIPPQAKVIVVSALWRRWKRLKEIIKLFSILKTNGKYDFKLLVLGGNADCVVEDKDIIYAGEIKPDELAPWYRTGDLYLHLATVEPSGNTQLEALACGLPVVCANNGGIGETIINASGGIVSLADKPYDFTFIDFYNPSEPNYDVLIKDILTIFDNYQDYRQKIKRGELDINLAAKKYVAFMKKIYQQNKKQNYESE